MNANTYRSIIDSTVSISELTKAGAKKIFDSLKKTNSKIILKNNKPVAALLSTERYEELLEKEEDLLLLEFALERSTELSNTISESEFKNKHQIDENILSDLPDIEME